MLDQVSENKLPCSASWPFPYLLGQKIHILLHFNSYFIVLFDLLRAMAEYSFRIKNSMSWGTAHFVSGIGSTKGLTRAAYYTF